MSVRINLDGNGVADSSTGIPFLDHMLDVSVCLQLFSFNSLNLIDDNPYVMSLSVKQSLFD